MATSVGKYLLDRLHHFGVNHIFGVPGDYVLRLDKMIEQHQIHFINTTRESTAGYAADAYARLKGLGVACITYGVGINITNAMAQAYVESSPLIVISGTAGTDEFAKCQTRHHLINKSISVHCDTTQLEIFKQLTVDQAVLHDPETAAAEIDRVIDSCLFHKKPVYIEIPRNIVPQTIPSHHAWKKKEPAKSDQESLSEALEETRKILQKCKRPMIWAGHELLRDGLSQALLQFAEKHHIPVVSSLLGKTVISEYHPLSVGVYQGGMSPKEVCDFVESCDCALILGVVLDDLDTGIFTAKIDQEHRVVATSKALNIGHHHFHEVLLKDYVEGLSKLDVKTPFSHPFPQSRSRIPQTFHPVVGKATTTKRLFECIQKYLRPEHLIVADVGDCLFGAADLVLDYNSFLACAYFASLGFGVPGAIGAQIASPDRRVVCIVGDGAFQMTATELSAAVRYHLDPIVILLNNHGYGTERPLLEGTYNDIQDWNYTELPSVFGGGYGIKVTTEDGLDKALSEAFSQRGTFYLIEVDLGKTDFSPALRRLGELLGQVVNGKKEG